MLATLTSNDFLPLLQQEFQINGVIHTTPAQVLERAILLSLRLVEVSELGHGAQGHDAAGRRPFSLLFWAPTVAYLPQQIYQLVHSTLGTLDLFLVPLGPHNGGMLFQAVFA